jgi:hypothetical protein
MMSVRGSMGMPMRGGTALMFLITWHFQLSLMDKWVSLSTEYTGWHFMLYQITLKLHAEIQVLCVHGGLSPDVRTVDQVCWTSVTFLFLTSQHT